MKISGKIITSLLTLSLVAGDAVASLKPVDEKGINDSLSHLFSFERDAFHKTYAEIPPVIRAFEDLDFDSRMERQEYLRLKYGDQLFMDTLRHRLLKQNSDIEVFVMASEIVALGRPRATLGPDMSMHDVAQKCGLNRLCALMDLKQADRATFWNDKNQFYREAVSAEFVALTEVGSLFGVEEMMSLRQTVRTGVEALQGLSSQNSYQEVILDRARERLNQDRQLCSRHILSEQH